MTSVPSGSKRWTHFHSALQLAIQRSTHKWTYEDFTECFSLWCEEQPEASATLFNTVAQHMESNITNRCEDLLTQFNVKENVDKLHAVVTEARARKQVDYDYDGKDLWKENLPPRDAVRAKTVPLLQQERDRLKAELEELDQENQRLQAMMQANIDAQNAADEQTTALLDLLDEACKRWNDLPMEEIESWRLATAESITPSIPK